MPIPNFNNIKELKKFLNTQKLKKIKYSLAEVIAAKAKVKPK